MESEKTQKWYKWISKVRIVILILFILVYLLIILGDTKGKKLQYDESHVIYYSEDYFDPSFVRIVGDSLKGVGYFNPNIPLDIQLFRSLDLGDTVAVGYVVDPSKLTPEINESFKQITEVLYPLFRTPTKIRFLDPELKTVKEIFLR